jgi:hypothetical protein
VNCGTRIRGKRALIQFSPRFAKIISELLECGGFGLRPSIENGPKYNRGMDDKAIAFWTFVAGVIAAVAAVGAVVIGLIAIRIARKAPEKKDLARVEEHTEATAKRLSTVETHIRSVDGRLRTKNEKDSLQAAAARVSIKAEGTQDVTTMDLTVRLSLREDNVTIAMIELRNEAGVLFGSVSCIKSHPKVFDSVLNADIARAWFNAGSPDGTLDRKLVVMRAVLLIDDHEAYREFVVYLSNVMGQVGPSNFAYMLRLEGQC